MELTSYSESQVLAPQILTPVPAGTILYPLNPMSPSYSQLVTFGSPESLAENQLIPYYSLEPVFPQEVGYVTILGPDGCYIQQVMMTPTFSPMNYEVNEMNYAVNETNYEVNEMNYYMVDEEPAERNTHRTKRRKAKKNSDMVNEPVLVTTAVVSQKDLFCRLCKSNNESARVYTSHSLKNEKGETTCPVLQKFVCPQCQATGLQAHTIKYCPLSEETGQGSFQYKKVLNSCGREYTRKY